MYHVYFASRRYGVITIVVESATDRDDALAQAKPQVATITEGRRVCPLAVEPVAA